MTLELVSTFTTQDPPPPSVGAVGDVATAPATLLRPQTYWVGTFDNLPDWRTNFAIGGWTAEANTAVGTFGIAGANGRILRVTHVGSADQLTRNGATFYSRFTAMGIPGGGMDECYLRYRTYHPAGYDWVAGGKLPGLAGNMGGSIFQVGEGGNYYPTAWSGRCLFQGDHGMSTYLYVAGVGGQTIATHKAPRPGDPAGGPYSGPIYGWSNRFKNANGSNMLLSVGAWNTVVLHYKMNTPGQYNGIFRGWINGALGITMTNVMYRDSGHAGLDANILMFSNFFGGPTGPKTTQVNYFDDVAITSARLPVDGG